MSFLDNEQDFSFARDLVKRDVESALLGAGSPVLSDWLDCQFVAMTDEEGANAYSGIDPAGKRGVLVILWSESAPGEPLGVSVDKFGDPSHPDELTEYLKLNCVLSPSVRKAVQELAKAWFVDRVDAERILQIAAQLPVSKEPEGPASR
jgi:hypothetical protein